MKSRWWRIVAGVGLVAGVGEVIDSLTLGWGSIGAIVVAALFFLGAWLTVDGRAGGPVIVGLLCLLEVAFFPTYPRDTTIDWIAQVFFLVLGATGLVASAVALLERRRSPMGAV